MDIRTFLAHAIKLEAAAAQASDSLADAMETWGNRELEMFFRQMAEFSRLHLKEAMDRAGFRHVSELPAEGYMWPDGVPPESAAWFSMDGLMGMQAAIELALDAEKRGWAFYSSIAETEQDPRVRRMAAEFSDEEREHVLRLESLKQKIASRNDEKHG